MNIEIPIPPNFTNVDLQARKPELADNGSITSADILAAKLFESRLTTAVSNSDETTFAEVHAWKLYIIDLEHSRC